MTPQEQINDINIIEIGVNIFFVNFIFIGLNGIIIMRSDKGRPYVKAVFIELLFNNYFMSYNLSFILNHNH
jgi:hypothetical protein